jgi:hypothetical protein
MTADSIHIHRQFSYSSSTPAMLIAHGLGLHRAVVTRNHTSYMTEKENASFCFSVVASV